jgi:hypothetical protein
MDVEDQKTKMLEIIKKSLDVTILSLTLQDPEKWTSLEGPHIVVDIYLPSEGMKEIFETSSAFISQVSEQTQGKVESIILGELILRGLYLTLKDQNLKTIPEISAKVSEMHTSISALVNELGAT